MRTNNKFIFICFCVLSQLMPSCKKDFLNVVPPGEYSEEVVWTDPALTETFVNSIYRNVLGFPGAMKRLSDFVDESRTTWDPIANFNKSIMTPDNLYDWQSDIAPQMQHYRWNPLYLNVRRTNMFFENIDRAPELEEAWVNRMKGEVYFLRGMTYHYLVALYGGVPLITRAYDLYDEFNVPRNTYEECIDYIVGQLDSAALYLPEVYAANQSGRATKGAALALKARVLLYAASDLHNPAKNGVVSNGYSNPELIGYTGGDALARWRAAKDAAKAVMDMNVYSLFRANPAPTDSVAQNLVDYFLSYGNEEDILLKYFVSAPKEDWFAYDPGRSTGPNGYNLWGNQTPLQELIDDYEMKDGTKFDWNNPVHSANPYENREARFYATVLYEGALWRERPPEAQTIDPWNRIQVGRVYTPGGVMVRAGIDTRDGPINVANGGYTGYYLRKWIDPVPDAAFVLQDQPYRHIRYAEVLMNYAEASIELGEDGDAHQYINMIRRRAGQPDLDASLTGDALKTAYRGERRIEFAFEDDFRFWDVRRWLIGDEAYKQTHSIDIRYIAPGPVDTYRRPDGTTWSDPTFTVVETPNDFRDWDNKAYFFPIMRDEMNKNDQLIQNPGYD